MTTASESTEQAWRVKITQAMKGKEELLFRRLLQENMPKQNQASPNLWTANHPSRKGRAHYDSTTKEWEISPSKPGDPHWNGAKLKGKGTCAFIAICLGKGSDETRLDISQILNIPPPPEEEMDESPHALSKSKPTSNANHQTPESANSRANDVDEAHYFSVPALWWSLVLKNGANAARVASLLLLTATFKKKLSLQPDMPNPTIDVAHSDFLPWGLTPATASRAVNRLVKAGLILAIAGKGRTKTKYTLVISPHFSPRRRKSRTQHTGFNEESTEHNRPSNPR